MSDTHHTDSKDEQPKYADLMKSLGCVWSEENEAWVHSKYGMGLTSQIEPELLNSILTAEVRKAEDAALKRGFYAGQAMALVELNDCHENWKKWNVPATLKAERNGRENI